MELDIELRIKDVIKSIGYEKIQEDEINSNDILKMVSIEAQNVGAQISVKWIKENYDYNKIIKDEINKLKKQQQPPKKRPVVKNRYSPKLSGNKSFTNKALLNNSLDNKVFLGKAEDSDSDDWDQWNEDDFSVDSDDEPISNLFEKR